MLIQTTASSLSPSASSKASVSCAANNVNPRTRANARMWNLRFKSVPSQAERIVLHSTSTLIRTLDDEKVLMWRPFDPSGH